MKKKLFIPIIISVSFILGICAGTFLGSKLLNKQNITDKSNQYNTIQETIITTESEKESETYSISETNYSYNTQSEGELTEETKNDTADVFCQKDKKDEALKLYREFLKGERKITYSEEEMDIKGFIYGHNEKNIEEYKAAYALFDTNGDEIPELHIWSIGFYYIISYKNSDLFVFADLAYCYDKQLNNGAFLYTREGGAPDHVRYAYIILGYNGDEIFRLDFEKYDVNYFLNGVNDIYGSYGDGIYDENDEYFFNNVKVSYDMWNELTKEYFSIGSDKIKWFDYSAENLSF